MNNAGVAIIKPLNETSEKEWDQIIDINLKGTFLMTKEILPIMIKQHSGVIINISSGAGKHGFPGLSAYCASKFGMIGITESLAGEVSRYGIKVFAVCPGTVDTKMIYSIYPEINPAELIKPEKIAKKVLELSTPGIQHTSGSSHLVYW